MTPEQSAPQSEENPLKITINELTVTLDFAKRGLEVAIRNGGNVEGYQAKVSSYEFAIRILEAWPTIKRTLEEYANKDYWREPSEYDPYANLWEPYYYIKGQRIETTSDGYVPAKRALALVKGDGK